MEIGSVTDDWDWDSLDFCGCFKKDTDTPESIDFHEHVAPSQPTEEKPEMPKDVQVLKDFSATDCKIRDIYQGNIQLTGWEAKAGAKFEWGGQDGVTFKGDACFKASDDSGNYTEFEIEQESNGTGSVSVAGGHKEAD